MGGHLCLSCGTDGHPSCALKAVPPRFGLQREDSAIHMKPFVTSDQICKPSTTTYYTGTLTDPLPKRHVKPGLEPRVYASRGVGGESNLRSTVTASVITMKFYFADF